MIDVDIAPDFFRYAAGKGHTTMMAMGVAAYLIKNPRRSVVVFVRSMPSRAHVQRCIKDALIDQCGDLKAYDRITFVSVASQRMPIRGLRAAAAVDNGAITEVAFENARRIESLKRTLKDYSEQITRLELELRNLSADAVRNAPLVHAAKKYADAYWQEKRDEIKRERYCNALPDDEDYRQDQTEWCLHMEHTSQRAMAEMEMLAAARGATPADVHAYYVEQGYVEAEEDGVEP